MAKIKDLSPKLSGLVSAEQELQTINTDTAIGQKSGGLDLYSSSFKRGYGNQVFGSDTNGIWLGAADFDNAPFRVNMEGSLFTQSEAGNVVIDTPNNRILIYDDDEIPIILIGYQENGF